ncbi:hypothetical protein SUDANB120_05198 [Streptomyces sp. enrichment culture]
MTLEGRGLSGRITEPGLPPRGPLSPHRHRQTRRRKPKGPCLHETTTRASPERRSAPDRYVSILGSAAVGRQGPGSSTDRYRGALGSAAVGRQGPGSATDRYRGALGLAAVGRQGPGSATDRYRGALGSAAGGRQGRANATDRHRAPSGRRLTADRGWEAQHVAAYAHSARRPCRHHQPGDASDLYKGPSARQPSAARRRNASARSRLLLGGQPPAAARRLGESLRSRPLFSASGGRSRRDTSPGEAPLVTTGPPSDAGRRPQLQACRLRGGRRRLRRSAPVRVPGLSAAIDPQARGAPPDRHVSAVVRRAAVMGGHGPPQLVTRFRCSAAEGRPGPRRVQLLWCSSSPGDPQVVQDGHTPQTATSACTPRN